MHTHPPTLRREESDRDSENDGGIRLTDKGGVGAEPAAPPILPGQKLRVQLPYRLLVPESKTSADERRALGLLPLADKLSELKHERGMLNEMYALLTQQRSQLATEQAALQRLANERECILLPQPVHQPYLGQQSSPSDHHQVPLIGQTRHGNDSQQTTTTAPATPTARQTGFAAPGRGGRGLVSLNLSVQRNIPHPSSNGK
jgi:hypothetical protein